MGQIFAYSLVSSLLLAAMYLVFKWMLAGENQHRYNRAMLWLIYGCALGLPALVPLMRRLAASSAPISGGEVEIGLLTLEGAAISVTDSGQPLWPKLLLVVYSIGIAAVVFYTAVTAVKLWKKISNGERIRHGRYTIVITPDTGIAPFSWCRYIVMNRADYEISGEVITLHETRHLDARHWIDLFVAQTIAVFQWYNPAAWLMREELKSVHEYQADEAVIRSGADPRQYQMLLIKKAVGARFPSLANSLNHSKLKKRVTMMYKSKSSTARRLRALALLPAGAIALLLANLPAVASAINEASAAELTLPADKVTDFQPETKAVDLPLKGKIISIVAPENGKSDVAAKTVPANGGSITVKANSADTKVVEVKNLKGSPDVYVNGVKQPLSLLSLLSPDEIQSITVKKDKNPDGEIYVTLKPDAKAAKIAEFKQDNLNDKRPVSEIFTAVEQMPRYPGGEKALMEFVAKNVQYPEAAMKSGSEGRVVVRFVVGPDGKVGDATVIRNVSPELDAEAIRVVGTLPDFVPGMFKGKPVSCYYAMPISFKLSKDDANPENGESAQESDPQKTTLYIR